MKTVFADTFYMLALLNERDPAHAPATDASRGFTGTMVTTAWVLTELANALSGRRKRTGFLRTLDALRRNPRAIIVPPTEELFERGVELYAERPDKG
ncbi:MAG: type II toxin-antitoxin system VapC family toxin [Planctomycetota bacterium]|jgi:predicted nucleic acid-binding protein